jgi:hypothetical protein
LGRSPGQTILQDKFDLDGSIIQAWREPGEGGGGIVIRGLVHGRVRRVRVPLSGQELALALEAFQSARRVQLSGRLVRQGRSLLLLQAHFRDPVAQEVTG